MKNLLLFSSFFFLTVITSYSQITLTSSINPVPGDATRYIDVDTTGITQGNSGANQTWNFTNLTVTDSFQMNYVSPSGTPYSSSFPTSNLASTEDNNFYAYYTTSTSSWIFNGIGGPSLIQSLSNPATYLSYPFGYGTNQSDNFAGQFTISGITWYRTGTINSSGDAWGTINLPFGSFSNCLRVKLIQTTKDSAMIGGFPIVINTTETSYMWFAPNKKFEVFTVGYSESNNSNSLNSGKGGSKWIMFNRNEPIGIRPITGTTPSAFNLSQNYPNPFNPSTSINIDIPKSSFVKLAIFDIIGREVAVLLNQNLNVGSYQVTWDASNISSGIYFYSIEADGYRDTKRMNLIK